jgi:hypothetical protein
MHDSVQPTITDHALHLQDLDFFSASKFQDFPHLRKQRHLNDTEWLTVLPCFAVNLNPHTRPSLGWKLYSVTTKVWSRTLAPGHSQEGALWKLARTGNWTSAANTIATSSIAKCIGSIRNDGEQQSSSANAFYCAHR